MTEQTAEIDPRIEIARTNIRMAAAMRGITISEVSRRAGLSRSGLAQFVNGRTSLSYTNMLKVCDVLGVPIGMLHRADAISETRVRIWRALERMPDHMLERATIEAREVQGGGH